ncbi:thioredoxin family protein [Accumulibacter sp.]|uniref:thioredoxin family protein n=1 Tax=Accumulibacter sp. TaxID=2053492 RepID=UPI0025FCD56A|nr:thioredoxin family protein [Accumulibacter sp.]MCM8595231.1 thioredoxin family protein [Accumulibacter sp.]MCM8626864.1 thioredoxin family protein [Accumulibacter sp.]MDS4049377.1 thioredoxin family protein [Accumulibacter sp.]
MLNIKILGPGCANCRKLEQIAREVVAALGVEARVSKVTAMDEILAYDLLKTPGLVIDEKLVCSGRIPTPAEVGEWIRTALETRRPAAQ